MSKRYDVDTVLGMLGKECVTKDIFAGKARGSMQVQKFIEFLTLVNRGII